MIPQNIARLGLVQGSRLPSVFGCSPSSFLPSTNLLSSRSLLSSQSQLEYSFISSSNLLMPTMCFPVFVVMIRGDESTPNVNWNSGVKSPDVIGLDIPTLNAQLQHSILFYEKDSVCLHFQSLFSPFGYLFGFGGDFSVHSAFSSSYHSN